MLPYAGIITGNQGEADVCINPMFFEVSISIISRIVWLSCTPHEILTAFGVHNKKRNKSNGWATNFGILQNLVRQSAYENHWNVSM
jgi:hypothetical protein